ncbi:MAG TPA: TlpA disulfide reductase family protein [Candidatus Limnocylindrales bacterium]
MASADEIRVGQAVPPIAGSTLDGVPFDLADVRGHPVLINFWGPSCVPCRDEFPLFKQMLAEHASQGLMIVGVLFLDDVPSAKAFATEYAATWPTVIDPTRAIAKSYRVVARPQSYFVDKDGILRSIQVGQVTQADFERQFAAIATP